MIMLLVLAHKNNSFCFSVVLKAIPVSTAVISQLYAWQEASARNHLQRIFVGVTLFLSVHKNGTLS